MGVPYAPNIRKWPYLCNGWSDPLYVWFYGGVFGDGGSNGAIYGSNTSKMAATAMLKKIQVGISQQPVVRSTSCFVLGWVFTEKPTLHSRTKHHRFGRRHLGKILNGHISAQPVVRSTSCLVIGFSGRDLMALFSIRTNSRWRPPPSWII